MTTEPGKKRKPVEVSPIASPAKARAKPNMAIYEGEAIHPVLKQIIMKAEQWQAAYDIQRNDYISQWETMDNFYWMEEKDCRIPDLTRAKVSASVYYRTNRRLANGANLATFPTGIDKLPVKFAAKQNVFQGSEERQIRALKAQALNDLALQYFGKSKIEEKRSDAYHRVYKYQNAIYYVPYEYEIERRKKWTDYDPNEEVMLEGGIPSFVHKDTGEVSPVRFPIESVEEEYNYVCKDNTGFYNTNLRDIWLDRDIQEIDRQTALFWRTDMVRSEIFAEARAGRYMNVERIGRLQEYDAYGQDSQVENQEKADAGESTFHATETERYERWRCWLMLPKIKIKQNAKGDVTDLTWDQNAEPRRYLLEMVGKLGKTAIPVRFTESPYWSNGVPFIAAHSHDDDVGFYHRGLYNLLEDNILQEQVAKGQYIDNKTLQNWKPFVRVKGRCFTKDMRMGPSKVYDVSSIDALKELEIKDNTQMYTQVLSYLENDSERIANTPKFMLGEAMGSRTSATEFAQVRDSSAAPALNDIKTLNYQIWGGFMRKVKEYAPQFLDKPLIVGDIAITPDEFQDIDLDLEEVATTEFDNRQVAQQIITNLASVFQGPMFQGIVNPASFFVTICSQWPNVFPNPEMHLLKNPTTVALLLEMQTQKPQQAPQEAPQPPMMEGQQMAATAGAMGGV